nr:hypothetical protein [Tanacetum cinerariifolium]
MLLKKAQSVDGKWVIGRKWVLLATFQIVVPSEVVVDKDDETLVLFFDEALGVGDVFRLDAHLDLLNMAILSLLMIISNS